VVLFTCCKTITDDNIDFYLYKIQDDVLSSTEINQLKNKNDIELVTYIEDELLIQQKVGSFFQLVNTNLDSLLFSKGIINNRNIALFVALHYKLNNEIIDYELVKENIIDYHNWSVANEKKIQKRNTAFAKINYTNFEIGDTICIRYPVKKHFNSWHVIEGGRIEVFQKLNNEWDDLLIVIEAIILQKYNQRNSYNLHDNDWYVFQVEPLSVSYNKNINKPISHVFEVGEPYELHLNTHKLILKECTSFSSN
jgi:hypothetical protein